MQRGMIVRPITIGRDVSEFIAAYQCIGLSLPHWENDFWWRMYKRFWMHDSPAPFISRGLTSRIQWWYSALYGHLSPLPWAYCRYSQLAVFSENVRSLHTVQSDIWGFFGSGVGPLIFLRVSKQLIGGSDDVFYLGAVFGLQQWQQVNEQRLIGNSSPACFSSANAARAGIHALRISRVFTVSFGGGSKVIDWKVDLLATGCTNSLKIST